MMYICHTLCGGSEGGHSSSDCFATSARCGYSLCAGIALGREVVESLFTPLTKEFSKPTFKMASDKTKPIESDGSKLKGLKPDLEDKLVVPMDF